MTKKEIIQKFKISSGVLTNLILGYPKFKYSPEKKRGVSINERTMPFLKVGTDYKLIANSRCKIYFTERGIAKIKNKFGVRNEE